MMNFPIYGKIKMFQTTNQGWWLNPTPLKNMSSSISTIIPIWENQIHVPVTTNQTNMVDLNIGGSNLIYPWE